MLRKFIVKLQDKVGLSADDFSEIVEIIASETFEENQLSALLVLISEDSLTPDGLAAFVKNILKHSKTFKSDMPMIDVCGTGGDGFKTINVSTTSAFLIAAMGAKVAKHGNRAVSSKSGSSDILDVLGIPLEGDILKQQTLLKEKGLAFFHAPLFHKLVGNVRAIRQKLGVRTIFNILGPLLHPNTSLSYQLVGIYHKPVHSLYAETLQKLGRKKALIVRGNDGLDEITMSNTTKAIEITQSYIKEFEINPRNFGFSLASNEEIKGGNPEENKEILIATLKGKVKGAKRDIVVLNAMYGLYTAEYSDDLMKIKSDIENAIDSGHIYDFFRNYIDGFKG